MQAYDGNLNAIRTYGPDDMRLGAELKVRCHGSDSVSLKRRKFVLMEKYKHFGLFVDVRGVRRCFTWWEVAQIADHNGSYCEDGISWPTRYRKGH